MITIMSTCSYTHAHDYYHYEQIFMTFIIMNTCSCVRTYDYDYEHVLTHACSRCEQVHTEQVHTEQVHTEQVHTEQVHTHIDERVGMFFFL
jgi:hypothetical protein